MDKLEEKIALAQKKIAEICDGEKTQLPDDDLINETAGLAVGGSKTIPLTEGKVRKGGQNDAGQFAKRPPPPSSNVMAADVPIQKQTLPTTEEVDEVFAGAVDALSAAVSRDIDKVNPVTEETDSLKNMLRTKEREYERQRESIMYRHRLLIEESKDCTKALGMVQAAMNILYK